MIYGLEVLLRRTIAFHHLIKFDNMPSGSAYPCLTYLICNPCEGFPASATL